jgi:hypothetical protein
MRSMQPVAWHGETACPSLLDPRTTDAFLATTYDAYRRELGDLWQDVPAIFTDEPHRPGESHGPWGRGLHLTPYLLGQFRQRRGYDLRPHLASVFYDVGDYRRIRFDLYDLMHELWVENWARPLKAWCERHGIALTGHYLEHDWPCPYATPGHVHMLVEQDGRVIAQLQEPPYQIRLERNRDATVTLRVMGLPKNLLGPWHDPGAPAQAGLDPDVVRAQHPDHPATRRAIRPSRSGSVRSSTVDRLLRSVAGAMMYERRRSEVSDGNRVSH